MFLSYKDGDSRYVGESHKSLSPPDIVTRLAYRDSPTTSVFFFPYLLHQCANRGEECGVCLSPKSGIAREIERVDIPLVD
jgi:hypothetical protein